jgi:hypothetical protein
MVKERVAASLVIFLSHLATSSPGQQAPTLRTAQDIEAFTQGYYRAPRPEFIKDLIGAIRSTGLFQKTTAIPPYIGFFSEIFAANPDRVPEWQGLLAAENDVTQLALTRALTVSSGGGVLSIADHSPQFNDMCWGGFFASGRLEYLQRLVEQLRYWDERQDARLFSAGATAKWSLASNAQRHSVVRAALTGGTLVADARTRALIAEVLSQDPALIRADIAHVFQEQHGKPGWP